MVREAGFGDGQRVVALAQALHLELPVVAGARLGARGFQSAYAEGAGGPRSDAPAAAQLDLRVRDRPAGFVAHAAGEGQAAMEHDVDRLRGSGWQRESARGLRLVVLMRDGEPLLVAGGKARGLEGAV